MHQNRPPIIRSNDSYKAVLLPSRDWTKNFGSISCHLNIQIRLEWGDYYQNNCQP